MKKISLLFLLLLFFSFAFAATKTPPIINTEDMPAKGISMKSFVSESTSLKDVKRLERKEIKWTRLEEKLNRFIEKKINSTDHHRFGLFDDPVNKWFWFWIFGWSLGLIITLISGASVTTGFLGILWLLGFVGGSIALVIWLLKKFG